jgi:hypothetical protein
MSKKYHGWPCPNKGTIHKQRIIPWFFIVKITNAPDPLRFEEVEFSLAARYNKSVIARDGGGSG